jgi:hypothetical protein
LRDDDPTGIEMTGKNFNATIGKFLKNFNQTAELEIERKIQAAIASGKLYGHEIFSGAVTISIEKIDLNVTIYNKIEL